MKLRLRLLPTIVLAALLAFPAAAQIDPGNFEIVQFGQTVGEIFVPAHEPGQTVYVEHWVLFRTYTYPDGDRWLRTKIKAGRKHYTSEEDFFARAPWGPGYRYVRVDATDTDKLPGR